MPTPAVCEMFSSFRDFHKFVLNAADHLNDEQLHWKPEGWSISAR